MKVVITGGGGFLGQVLAKEILTTKQLRSETSMQQVTELILADICEPNEYLFDLHELAKSNGIDLQIKVGDVSDMSYCKSIIGVPPKNDSNALSVFHLGAVMSGAPPGMSALGDLATSFELSLPSFDCLYKPLYTNKKATISSLSLHKHDNAHLPDLAIKVNLHGTMNMLEATRAWQEASASRPTFMFSSAGATLGAGHEADWVQKNDTISDATRAAPHTTYGMTKACAELLLADYSRRGFLDGRGVRLPSVIVRAGSPNAATTSCFSSVVREPLSGKDTVVPVGSNVFHAVTGYRAAIGGMLAVHNAMPEDVDKFLGFDRTVFLPTRSVSMAQLEEGMKRVVSSDSISKLGKVMYEEDERLSSIVGSFPTKVNSARALALGAPPTPSIDDMIREYCEDFKNALADGVDLEDEKNEAVSTIQPNVDRVVALITGGGSGIGKQVAIRLCQGKWGGVDGHGNDSKGKPLRVGIILAGRRADTLQATKEHIESLHSDVDVLPVPCDITKEKDVENLMSAANKRFGRIDLLFNNAGINIAPQSCEDIESDDFQKVIDTNVTGCWRMAKHCMKIMSKQEPQGGRIVNNGSISAYSPRPGSAPYTASKHAVLGLTKSIALDGRKFNITCGQIDFGNVSSDMTKAVGGSAYSMSSGMPQANGTVMPEPTFSIEEAANTVFSMAALPLSANVLNMTVMASHMPYVGRG